MFIHGRLLQYRDPPSRFSDPSEAHNPMGATIINPLPSIPGPANRDRFLSAAACRGTPRRQDLESLPTPANFRPRRPLVEAFMDIGGVGSCCA